MAKTLTASVTFPKATVEVSTPIQNDIVADVTFAKFFVGESGFPKTVNIDGAGGVAVYGAASITEIHPTITSMVASGGVAVGGAAEHYSPVMNVEAVPAPLIAGSAAEVIEVHPSVAEHIAAGGVAVSGAAPSEAPVREIVAVLPLPTSSFVAQTINHIVGALSVPSASMSGGSNWIDRPLPLLTAELVGATGIVGVVTARVPDLAGSLTGGMPSFNAILPALTGAMDGYLGASGRLEATMSRPTGLLSGAPEIVGALAGALARPTAAFVANTPIVGSVNAAVYLAQAAAAGSPGIAGAMAGDLPVTTGLLSGYVPYVAVLDVAVSPLAAYLVGERGRTLVKVIAMNMRNGAVTEYQGVQFNSAARFGGKILIAGDGGVFALEGETDNGDPIAASFTTGKTDFGSAALKRVTDAYLDIDAAGPVSLRVVVGTALDYTANPGALGRRRKVGLAKGLKDRYAQFTIANVAGGDFDLDSLEVTALETARR